MRQRNNMKQGEYNNYKVGALKRKFNMGRVDVEPGTFIRKMNAQKAAPVQAEPKLSREEKVAIMGLI